MDVRVAEFISPSDQRWQEALQKAAHDFYHLPEYVSFAAAHEGGEPVAFYAEAGDAFLLIPLLIRKPPAFLEPSPQWRDATAPYGYPSPLLHPGEASPTLACFFEAFKHAARQKELISIFLRCHPLLELPLHGLENSGVVVHHGPTVYMDLSLSEEELWRGCRENHRRNIRKLQKRGFAVRLNDWSTLPDFIEIYQETMARLEASGFYFFSENYFTELRSRLEKYLLLATVVSENEEVAAAGLFLETSGIVEYHLGGTAEKYLGDAPSKMLFDAVWRWAKNNGDRLFHLGGGFGGRADSLFRFKEGFSKKMAPFHTFRLVAQEKEYATLIRRWREMGGDDTSHGGFFPLYRAPLATERTVACK